METLLHIALSNALLATVLAGLAFVVGLCCRGPALVHGLWLLVLLKLVTPPFVSVPLPWPALSAPPPAVALVEPPADHRGDESAGADRQRISETISLPARPAVSMAEEIRRSPASDFWVDPAAGQGLRPVAEPVARPLIANWPVLIVGIWLTGSLACLALACYRIHLFHQLLSFAQPAPEALAQQTKQLAERLGLRRCPSVWLLPGPVSPMLWTRGAAKLLLPLELLQRLPAEEVQTLLAHELAHYKRRDHWVRHLELLATGLYWWHPVVWWARRQLREVEELCCDAWVVWALPRAARAYARALIETVDFLSETRAVLPAAASGIGHIQGLKRRVTMILKGNTPRALSLGGLIAVLGLGAVLLPLLPTWAQDKPREQPARDKPQRPESTPQQREEADKLRAEIAKTHEHLQKMRQQMEETHGHLQRMVQRLAELEGRHEPRERGPAHDRANELERRLDAMMRELEQMRRELKGGHRPDGPPRRDGERPDGELRRDGGRKDGDRPNDRKPESDRPAGERKPEGDRPAGERKPETDRPKDRKPEGDRPGGDRKPEGDRPAGERKPEKDRQPIKERDGN